MDDSKLLTAFRSYQVARNFSPMTMQNYRHLHRRYVNWLAREGLSLTAATREDVSAFLATSRVSPGTRYSYISRLASLYEWMVDEGHATHDPTLRLPRPQVPEGVPRPIRTRDLELAIRTATPRNRAFLTLASFAGLRCREIAGLRVDDLLTHDEPPVLVVTSPKGLRERVVPLHDDVLTALRLWGGPRAGYVFPLRGDPAVAIRPHTVSHEGNRYLHELGIPATMHQLRHWFGTSVQRRGRNIRVTQELLGHRSSASTARYTQVLAMEAAEVVRALGFGTPFQPPHPTLWD